MADEQAHGYVLLAVLRELRPVVPHRSVKVEQSLLDQTVHADRRHALGHRIHVDDRVSLPGTGALFVGPAAPQVDHGLAVDHTATPAPISPLSKLRSKTSRT